jgi:hypothetical protein
VITLDRRIGDRASWLGYGWFTDDELRGISGNLAGYPTNREYLRMYHDSGLIASAETEEHRVLFPSIGAYSGQQGGGIYFRSSAGNRYVFAIAEADSNYVGCTDGVRLTREKYEAIYGWVRSGY